MSKISASKKKLQIVFAGVGGQGILFSSKIFSEMGLRLGLNVMGSETHGMSQRGGSVIAHLKLGDFYSPLIQVGNADILYSLEEVETYRALKFLKRGGLCFVNIKVEDRFDRSVLNYLNGKDITFLAFDASGTALKTGSLMSANIVLIGFSVGTRLVPFKYKDMREVLKSISPEKQLEINLKAFDRGFKEGEKLRDTD